MARRKIAGWVFAPAVLALAVLLWTACPGTSRAADGVAVDIGVVLASNEGSSVDPSLATLRAKLGSMFNYSSYKMLDRLRRPLGLGQTGDFGLPGGRSIRVTPITAARNKARLAIQIMEGSRNLVTTTVGMSRGGMVLVGGPRYQNGTLILLISAE
ncbi:MAG: hypothetical protein M1550_05800 [Deltaproteobacteria bacterium]|nr:hypothetical protein [Deltaproteobacteria bacterium]